MSCLGRDRYSSDASPSYPTSVEFQQPSLCFLNSLLSSATTALERAAEEKSLLLNKETNESIRVFLDPRLTT
ncbi:hypothetical protein MTR_6g086755 [Medicago truncatula]|uniref:Uncharacterized protein n=1 Tax=Medicago truncatula TaxID=3880 RepID=A0A072UDE3_MEDTR|nr:hypothetical protein MTR_6g086755 [Medicago truncatula]